MENSKNDYGRFRIFWQKHHFLKVENAKSKSLKMYVAVVVVVALKNGNVSKITVFS